MAVYYLREYPFANDRWWIGGLNPERYSLVEDSQPYYLTSEEKATWDQYFSDFDQADLPWHRVWAALETIGHKNLESVSAKHMLYEMARWGEWWKPAPKESLEDRPLDDATLSISKLAFRVEERWDKIDLFVKMDLYQPKRQSRLVSLLQYWSELNDDGLRTLRNEAIRQYQDRGLNSDLCEDVCRRAHELYEEYGRKVHSAKEVALFIQDCDGPRDGAPSGWATTRSKDNVAWCLEWVNANAAEIQGGIVGSESVVPLNEFTEVLNSADMKVLMKMNNIDSQSDKSVQRYKQKWDARPFCGSNQKFRFRLQTLRLLGVTYPPEWDAPKTQ